MLGMTCNFGLVNLDEFDSINWLILLSMIPLSGAHCTYLTSLATASVTFLGAWINLHLLASSIKTQTYPTSPRSGKGSDKVQPIFCKQTKKSENQNIKLIGFWLKC